MLGQPQPEGETGGSRLLAETKKSYLGVSVGWGGWSGVGTAVQARVNRCICVSAPGHSRLYVQGHGWGDYSHYPTSSNTGPNFGCCLTISPLIP